jgi:anti-anti-sigma factor
MTEHNHRDTTSSRTPARDAISTTAAPATVVTLTGDHDVTTAAELKAAIAESLRQCPLVVVDLTEVSFLDGAILRVLRVLDRSAREMGRRLGVVAPPSSLARHLLELTSLDTTLACFDGRAHLHNANEPASRRAHGLARSARDKRQSVRVPVTAAG